MATLCSHPVDESLLIGRDALESELSQQYSKRLPEFYDLITETRLIDPDYQLNSVALYMCIRIFAIMTLHCSEPAQTQRGTVGAIPWRSLRLRALLDCQAQGLKERKNYKNSHPFVVVHVATLSP